MGGLGNQLFQLNFYNYLKTKFPNAKIRINLSYYKKDSRHGGFMLNACNAPRVNFYITSQFRFINDKNYSEDFTDRDNILFEGYWQDMRFFIGKTLTFVDVFKGKMNKECETVLSQIIATPSSVSVHVRSGDYDNDPHLGNVSTKAYYNNAVKRIKESVSAPVFFVFSNNINWTKENVDFGESEVHYITCNFKQQDAKWDLFLMSKCHYNIISNSTFSWWSQFFNCHKDKKVITPPYWINEESSCFKEAQPNIQKSEYMEHVSNIPTTKKNEKNIKYSCILLLEDSVSAIKRSAATILNQSKDYVELLVVCKQCPNKSDVFFKLYSKNQNIRFFTADNNKILENAGGNYIVFVNNLSYFITNAFEKIEKHTISNDKSDAFEFGCIDKPVKINQVLPPSTKNNSSIENKIFNKEYIINLSKRNNLTKIEDVAYFLRKHECAYKKINENLLNRIIFYQETQTPIVQKHNLYYYVKRTLKIFFNK